MTAKEIESAKPGETIWDDQIKGLHLCAFQTKKVFYLYYRTKARQQRKPKLGNYGVLTLAAARDIAKERLGIVAAGGDPGAETERHTVQDLEKKFMAEHAIKRKPKTQEMYRICWNHIRPMLGSRLVSSVSRTEVAALHHRMRATPSQANRTVAVLKKAMNLAEVWGWRPLHSNPVHAIDMNRENKRRRYPTPEEAVRLIKAMNNFDHPIFTGYVWLLCLTGCRPAEIRTARREWVHPTGLHLPDSKGGERIVALPRAARDVIASLPKIKDNPYLIPGHVTNAPLVGTGKLWRRLLSDAKIHGLQMRDLRRFFASLGISNGLTLEAVGQLLGHTQFQTTKTYAYLMTDARQRDAEIAAAKLVRIKHRSLTK